MILRNGTVFCRDQVFCQADLKIGATIEQIAVRPEERIVSDGSELDLTGEICDPRSGGYPYPRRPQSRRQRRGSGGHGDHVPVLRLPWNHVPGARRR